MSLERISQLYYTAAEARAVLGLREHAFQNWVKAGKITRTMIPGIGQGMYLKREIDRKARLIEAALFLDTSKELEYRAAAPPDVDAEIHLAHLIYGKRAKTPEAQKARRRLVEINPESSWYLYDRDMLAASINIVPLTRDAIEEFKTGKRGWLFGKEAIKQFEPGEPLECIIIDFMSTPAVPPEKRNFYAQALLREFASTTLQQWGARGVDIKTLYTCGSTDAGRQLLRTSKAFKELGEPVRNRVIFELDIQHSDVVLLRPYKEALTEWKEQHGQMS